jgi:N-glycosylase/DNA lyase
MRVLRQEPWECLVSFICSANNNIPRITRNVGDIASAFGPPILDGASGPSAFPTAEQLAEAGETALRKLGLGFRAKYVAAAAERVAQSRIDLYGLREASYQDALDALVELAGVGDKIANCVLLFSLDKLEAFPVDVWIDRALRDWYFTPNGETVPRVRMRAWAQKRFGRYAGYANQYLFHQRRLEGRDGGRSS